MAQFIYIYPYNGIHFLREGTELDAAYHTKFPTVWTYLETVRPWEDKFAYLAKVQTAQHITLAFGLTTTIAPTITLYNEKKEAVHTWTAVTNVALAGDQFEPVFGGSQQIYQHIFQFSLADVTPALPAGYYWLRLEAEWDTDADTIPDVTRYGISEPLHIRADHPKTILLEYRNSANKEHFAFRQTGAIFGLRVDGTMKNPDYLSSDTTYEEQNFNARLLDSQQYTAWAIETGHLPAYMRQKLAYAAGCDGLVVEDKQLAKSGSDWEVGDRSGVLQKVQITLRQADNDDDFVNAFDNDLPIYTRPGTYPYALHTIQLIGGNNPVLASAVVIEDAAEEDDLLAAWNSAVKYQKGLYGSFYVSGDVVYYKQHKLEAYDNVTSLVMAKFFTLTISAGGLTTFAPVLRAAYVTVDFGDGTAVANYGNGNVVDFTVTHNYGGIGVGPWGQRVFHQDDDFTKIQTNSSRLSALTGDLPTTLTILQLSSSGITGFNAGILVRCMGTLQTFIMTNGALTSVSNFTHAYANLTTINLSGNHLTSSQVDNLFISYVNGVGVPNIPTGGVFIINNQIPAAPPTALSSGDRGVLASNGWTVTTD